ncbi:hypothetical protein NQ318_023203 [Aromia moschata]|uniref:WD repeat-containing protein 89 n=1 Tax=Aromia moschata TaxID=1265417 RepID=A0AAV8X2W4_9CUCU|nr:hypothetical protein NQ318_023203 [Aromia moschata]
MWDLRIPEKPALIFQDPAFENNTQARTFSCFDIACNERVITVGTDLFEGDAFLLFYDVRNSKFLGGYWESHTDDITQVKFHPYDRDKLISGSTDGLINIYDLSQSSEDDALIDTLNTQSSIEQLLWFGGRDKSSISCITHTSDLQLWHAEGAEPYKHFTRGDIAREIKVASEDYVYISKCHTADESLLVLAGSNDTEDCACSLYIRNGNLQPAVTLKENKQIVRSSWYNENTNILLTGGEKGILNVWKLDRRRDFNVKTKKSR